MMEKIRRKEYITGREGSVLVGLWHQSVPPSTEAAAQQPRVGVFGVSVCKLSLMAAVSLLITGSGRLKAISQRSVAIATAGGEHFD